MTRPRPCLVTSCLSLWRLVFSFLLRSPLRLTSIGWGPCLRPQCCQATPFLEPQAASYGHPRPPQDQTSQEGSSAEALPAPSPPRSSVPAPPPQSRAPTPCPCQPASGRPSRVRTSSATGRLMSFLLLTLRLTEKTEML